MTSPATTSEHLAGSMRETGRESHPSLPVDTFEPIDLAALAASATLARRYDAKYVVDRRDLPALVAAIGGQLRVLEVEGRRYTDYTSHYFDTPDLRTYRDHVMGRRRRFKLRTRHYGDPRATVLELKLKSSRGETLKHRWPHGAAPDELDDAGHERAASELSAAYGLSLPPAMAAVMVTAYRRTTLVDVAAGERVTIDEDLTIRSHDRVLHLGAEVAVVEVKAATLRGAGVRALGELGLRPDRISKYCVAVAAAYEDVRGNPWLPVLRQMAPLERH